VEEASPAREEGESLLYTLQTGHDLIKGSQTRFISAQLAIEAALRVKRAVEEILREEQSELAQPNADAAPPLPTSLPSPAPAPGTTKTISKSYYQHLLQSEQ
jgi:hypothetical protein